MRQNMGHYVSTSKSMSEVIQGMYIAFTSLFFDFAFRKDSGSSVELTNTARTQTIISDLCNATLEALKEAVSTT